MPIRTASASDAPPALATVSRLRRHCLVCSPTSPPTSSPVAGSSGVWPERNSSSPVRIAWLYGPTAAGAPSAVTAWRWWDMGAHATVQGRALMPNALAAESSPYLLQHRDNPVDWLPWGDEALRRAREQDRPLLVSIGYSSCHWCHVMER